MASNPMQKKTRNSFLLGMIITLIICIAIGVLFYFLISTKNKKEEADRGKEVTAYVLNTNVKSGQIITASLLSPITVYENMIPTNYVNNISISNLELQDNQGNELHVNSKGQLYINQNNNTQYNAISNEDSDKNKVLIQNDTNGYYKTNINGSKEYIELNEVPVVAKVDMYKNTILTADLISKSDQIVTSDVRYVEYNMLLLSTSVAEGDYIDVRLTLPSGQDLIVISKKEIKTLIGDTIGLQLSEGDILMMESAIVEAYIMGASKLYVTKYVEPGNQGASSNTYVPTQAVQSLINSNPNIVRDAKELLALGFDADRRNAINQDAMQYSGEETDNIEEKIQEEIENAKAAREAYLQGLTSY